MSNIDFGLWVTLCMNLFLVYEYIETPRIIDTIILLFYVQSVLIGIFNALDMFTVTNSVGESGNMSAKGCAGLFFLVHYGIFHLVYLFFLPQIINYKNVDWHFFMLTFYIILSSCLITFIQDKWRNRHEAMNLSAMFFMPYARIVPMHLTILLPQFLKISAPLLFLVLKTLADVVMYLVYRRAVFRPLKPVEKKALRKV